MLQNLTRHSGTCYSTLPHARSLLLCFSRSPSQSIELEPLQALISPLLVMITTNADVIVLLVAVRLAMVMYGLLVEYRERQS